MFEQEFKNQLEEILGEQVEMDIACQIKSKHGLKETNELCRFFYKIGDELDSICSKPKGLLSSTTFYVNLVKFKMLHERIMDSY